MPGFSLSFDPQSLSRIAQFAGFGTLLSGEVQAAMQTAGQMLVTSVQSNMHWVNPTGALEASIQVVTDSPFEIEVGSDLPYARRREFGFSQMVDSLGRYYPNDPGAFYFLGAYNEVGPQVSLLIESAAQNVIDTMAA